MPRLVLVHLIRRFGGSPGLLDQGRPLAAPEGPWATFGGQDLFPTPWEVAEVFQEHLQSLP
ncbi:hypothetical protein [Thermus igniterrae]|uniref:hypothetical protein n=1 Tax=Thermus igniterrae TaxID=88189 RepID=UPI0003613E96|nr:hypothetical protein [Thermus igniterrae]